MVHGKSKSKVAPEKEFSYVFDKLNKAVDKCDDSALEWVAASTRVNEKALHKGDIMEDTYMERQQQITSLLLNFSYNCRCSPRTQTMML
jgi:hypothetical protein